MQNSFFIWKDSFRIGVEGLDRQHRAFLEYLNICHLNVSATHRGRIDTALLENLREYATVHFRFEEDLMDAGKYPDMEHHIKQHRYFEAQLDELEAIQLGESEKTTGSLLVFMRDWFLDHILEEDKKIKQVIKEKLKGPEILLSADL